jgi:anti-sigma-K factor RskA
LTERVDVHVDLGGYLLGRLDEGELALVEEHLAICERCRAAAAELEATAALLARAAAPVAPPADLEQRTMDAVRVIAEGEPERIEAAGARPSVRLPRLSWPRRLALAGFAAAALAVAVFGGTLLNGDPGLPGTPELEATLASRSGATATASVRMTGIGRVVDFRTDDLPILPKGQYYELWFVGPGDRRGAPNRISAGTFHPDENGRSNVRFAAAVDPAKYPRLAVTAEPGDGNPRPNRPDVLRSRRRQP